MEPLTDGAGFGAGLKVFDSTRPGLPRGERLTAGCAGTVFFVVALVGLAPPSSAQRYLVHTYTEASGLPSSHVFAVTQDATGQMWFATRTGVACYDGLNWRTYAPATGVPQSSEALYRWDDRAGLWVTEKRFRRVLHRFDGTQWVTIDGPPSLAAGTFLTALGAGSLGSAPVVALGAEDGRVFYRVAGDWRTVRLDDGPVLSIAIAGGRLFAGTHDGLRIIELDDPDALARPVESISDAVWAVSPDSRDGGLWLAGRDWLGRFRDRTSQQE